VLSLTPAAFEAVIALKGTPEWRAYKSGLIEHMTKFMHAAVESGDKQACGYAQAMRDLVWAIDAAEAGPGQGAIAARTKPALDRKAG
jgi:hypothetical protein